MKKIIENPFRSFWMAGYECTDQLNFHGDRVDFLNITSHLVLIETDYDLISSYNIKVVREGVRWSYAETRPYKYDFDIARQMITIGREKGIQQIWDLCHFGFPDDLSPLHPHFTKRFESYCRAFAILYKELNPGDVLIVTPINEVGFISWLGGEVGATSPYCTHNGWGVKYAYVKAYIAGIIALKEIDPNVRILTTEPLVNITTDILSTEMEKQNAMLENQLQYQVLDMISGRICPELGGREEYLDIIGCNYYYNNQWIQMPHQVLGWNDPIPHENFKPLSEMLFDLTRRYNRPIMLSETSHPGIDRPIWFQYISNEIIKLLQANTPFWGICWYPIIDRPDWDNLSQWHRAGIWDNFESLSSEKRWLHQPSATALQAVQQTVAAILSQATNQNKFEIFIDNFLTYGKGDKIF